MAYTEKTNKYFEDIEKNVRKVYDIAEIARAKGFDPVNKVEIPLAMTMAAKCVGLISVIYPQMIDSGIDERILELEEEFGKLNPTVVFKIGEEVAKQKFCKFENQLQAIDAGIRIGFAYATIGVVSPPIEGFTELKLGKTRDGKDYFIAYFSGPIRAAGTTASCIVLMLIDFLRETFGYAKYDPDEEEVRRYVTENFDYHERVTNLQYFPLEEEIVFLAQHIPIQIAGDPTEKLEVSNYKNLERVDTDFIRGGMCLIFSEGLAQKAKKGFRLLGMAKENGVKCSGFDWIPEYLELHDKLTSGKGKSKGNSAAVYIKDLVAGRPVFGHPSCSGGFRFRYGRSRVDGFSAVSIHPATMAITDDFIAIGTQLKIEKPTKGCAVASCDSIECPIVKLFNGSVVQVKTKEEGKKLYKDVEEIIYLGDILFPFGDVLNRGASLVKPGYVEEWWKHHLEKNGGIVKNYFNVNLDEAIELSKKYKIPLHPKYIFYWTEITKELFLGLIEWLKNSRIDKKLILPYNKEEQEKFELGKRALELLGVSHEVTIENVVLTEENSKALFVNLGIDLNCFNEENFLLKDFIDWERYKIELSVFEIINKFSEFEIKDKAGTFIGTRMGRPEKAKLRKLQGSPNILFPVGREGGRLRSMQAACEVGNVKSSFPIYFCEDCKYETIYPVCEKCGKKNKQMYYFYDLKEKDYEKKIEGSEKEGTPYCNKSIEINNYFQDAVKKLGMKKEEIPLLIKGIRGMSSKSKKVEHIAKGILRAKHNLQVNKDGTIRFDFTELPIVSFKPKEIGVSIEKLKEIGYEKDIKGNDLVNEEQILEIMPHDVLLPCSPNSPDENADDVFIRICNFIDELLVGFYGLEPFYNIKTRDDLIGKMGVFMAPHNCAGVICRFIGFSKVQSAMTSPYMHAAVRRDCVSPITNFIYLENGEIRNDAIGSYVEKLISDGNNIMKIDSYGTIRVDIDKEIYAFGVDTITKKLKKKRIKYFIKGKPPEKWIKIKTCSGREQVMTSRHKFCYLDKTNNFKIKKASEIKIGDRIALLKNFNFREKEIEKIFLPKFLAENVPLHKLNDIRIINSKDFFKRLVKKTNKSKFIEILDLKGFNNMADWYKLIPLRDIKKLIDNNLMSWRDISENAKIRTIFNNKEWDLNLNISEDLVSVLGYYSAEGYSRQSKTVSQVCFRIMEREQQKKLVFLIKSAFGIKPNLGENDSKITICNKLVYYLFKYCFDCGSGAYEKRVPDIIYNVSDELVKSYLSCYFDGDGTIIYNKNGKFICFYSVSKKLLDGISLLGCRFGLFGRFVKTKERLPGRKVLERYKELGKPPKKHILHHLNYSGKDFYKLAKIIKPVHAKKLALINSVECRKIKERKIKYDNKFLHLEKLGDVVVDIVKKVEILKENKNSYCFDVDSDCEEDKNVLWGEQIINFRCDGDEAAIMLLADVLINFSKEFLPSHRGGTQDAPLVLNAKINAGEVDDQILDFECVNEYPLELYEMAEKGEHSSKVKIRTVKDILKEEGDPFVNIGFTHDTSDFNEGVDCSSYKLLATMKEKVQHQMELVERIRAADTVDTARLIIDRHFIRDIRGNLRKFSMQGFRCVACNEIMRRPPLSGVCTSCGGKLIFTIHEGGIKKYLEPALDLAKKYNLSPYLKQNLELIKRYVDSIFGKELEKQQSLDEFV